MAAEVDPEYKVDNRKLMYREPQTNVAWLVQQPLYKIDGLAVVNAYMADFRESRKE